MLNKEVGVIIKKLRNGETVSCPECKSGKIMPEKKNEKHFHCSNCDFVINID